MFIQCANGRAYTKQCPKYLVWNNQKKTCVLGNYQVKNSNELLMSSSAQQTISPFTPTITQLEFSLAALKAHNTYRKVHGVPPLVLNTDLMQMAQVTAESSSFQLSHKQYNGFALGESFLGSSKTNTGLFSFFLLILYGHFAFGIDV
jgi:hypothetical protein